MGIREFEHPEERIGMDTKLLKRSVLAVIGTVILVAGLVAWFIFNSSSCSRTFSRWEAEYGHGVEREVTLYSASGEQVGHWEGVIDVEYIDDRVDLIFFDSYGRVNDRVIINPGAGTLVIDET